MNLDAIKFLAPRLIGSRFDSHAIPLEFLKDLAAFQEMIVEIAKFLFLEDNPKRKRSPRAFNNLEMRLTSIEPGSAIPVIELFENGLPLFAAETESYFTKAREALVSAVYAADSGQSITDHLPRHILRHFEQFGRGLLETEAVEFTSRNHSTTVRYTRQTRRTFRIAATKKDVTDPVSLYGTVPEVDQKESTFDLLLFNNQRITAPIKSQYEAQVWEAFRHFKQGRRVKIDGVGRYNQDNKLQQVESVADITILDDRDIPARLNELGSLRSGWMNGEGKVLSKSGLEHLINWFGNQYPADLTLPYLYPTLAGGVRAEWTLSTYEITLDFHLESLNGELHAVDLNSGDEVLERSDYSQPDSWKQLADYLRMLEVK